MRHLVAPLSRNERGFALQTVIVMTALIAIALAVSAVIVTRGGEVKDDLERQRLTRSPSEFTTQVLCEAYEYTWDAVNGQCT